MGIIQRQGSKSAIINFLGVGIGALSMIFIYSANKEIYGYAQWLYNVALFFIPLASIGLHIVVVKYYPVFKTDKQKDNGYLLMILSFFLISFSAFCILFFLFKNSFLNFLQWAKVDEDALIEANLIYIMPLAFLLGINLILTNQAANVQRIVIPDIITNLGYKIWLPILILLYAVGSLVSSQVAQLMLLFFSLVMLSLFIYLFVLGAFKLKRPRLELLKKGIGKQMLHYGAYGSLNSLGAILAFRIDVIMIGTMIGLEAAGLYAIMLFLAGVIEVPTKSLSRITSPIISEAWENNDMEEISTLYKKSSLNLLLIGIPAFILIWYSLGDLESISSGKNSFYEGRYIFLFLAIAKLIDMAAGLNSQIITYSSHYRYNLYFLLTLAVTNVFLNYYLLTSYGVIGAAMASAFSFALFNLIKYVFLYRVYGIQPFSIATVKLMVLGLCTFILLWLVPTFSLAPINAIVAGILILSIYGGSVISFKISPDATQTLDYLLRLIRLKKN